MKEFKSQKIIPLEVLKAKIWLMFDMLRKNGIGLDESYIILLFLSMYKDGLFSEDFHFNKLGNINYKMVDNIPTSKYDLIKYYQPIINSFAFSLLNLKEPLFQDVLRILYQIDKELLSDNFPDIFDTILYRIAQSEGKYGGEFIQPVELTRLMCSLAELPPNSNVYNPFAGLASFGVYLDKTQYYFGQEFNKKTWALGTLRLMANEKLERSTYVCDDSILHWQISREKYDLIIANPPFDSVRQGYEVAPGFRTSIQFLLEKGVESLKADGKLIALLPESFLFRGLQEQRLREYLVKEDLIDTIISLPEGLLQNSAIPLIVMVLNKAKEMPRKVRFVDARKFVVAKGLRGKVLNDQKLLNLLKGNKNTNISDTESMANEPMLEYNSINRDQNTISDYERLVDKSQIVEFDYNLNIPRYFQNKIEGVRLGSILELVRGQRENLPETGKLIRIRDLKDDKLDFSLDLSSVGDSELSRPFIYCISESCLLLAMRLKILKPTLFEFKGESIYKGHDIMSFKVNESTTDIAYLINELHADYVQEQLDSMRRGVAMPFIRKEDLLDVVIKFPSLGEQKAKVEGLKQAYIQAKEDKLKLEKELLGIKDDTFKEFASIKHTFRQYLGALKSNVTGTRKFLTKNEGKAISLNDIYSVKLNQTLADHLLSMDETIASLSKLLNVDSFNTIDNNVEILNLSELINGAHIRFHTDNIKFEFKVDEFSFNNGEEDLPPLIEINIEDFLRMFSNIVSNAITHGFKNSEGNIIRSSISYDDINEKCVLEVSNNGMPMPEKFTFQHLTTRGEKTTDSKGTGIGGADIKDIVIKNKGSFEIIKDATSIFPVTYKISFPIVKQFSI